MGQFFLSSFIVIGFLSRDKFQEGEKKIAAYHNPEFVKNRMLNGWQLLEFKTAGFPGMKQDLWVVRKPQSND